MKIISIIGNAIKNSRILTEFHNYLFKILNSRKFYKEYHSRKSLSIFEYKKLAEPLPFCPHEFILESNFYGNLSSLKKYCGIKSVNKGITMEHGLMYGNHVQKWYKYKTVSKVLTFSKLRAELIQNSFHKPAIDIGPYIHYTEGILNDLDFQALKKKLGKTLLFFPIHSTKEDTNLYDIQTQIKDISEFKAKFSFNTVLVSIHHYDILHFNYHKEYERAGFKVVCSGCGYDLDFLARQKSIISLADFTLSNAVGTHTGYCLYLNKPHWIPWTMNLSKFPPDYRKIFEIFRKFSLNITSEQRKIVHEYWGIESIKSPEEIFKILYE